MSLNNSIITQSMGIPYQQYVTSSAGHTLISSSTYFNDTSDNIPRYKDASGNIYDVIISSSYALTASHALNSSGGGGGTPTFIGSGSTSASADPNNGVVINASGSTLFDVRGSLGSLFSVTDSFEGNLFEVNNISGISLLTVSSSGDVDIPKGKLTVSSSVSASQFLGDGSQLTGISSTPFPFTGDAQLTGSLLISASNNTSESLSIQGSGSTIFSIQGSQGQLFSVTDDLLDEVFSVADISGDTLLRVSGSGLVTIPVGDLSGSATATASYGAFKGDGSQLTNLPASSPFPFNGDAVITGSLIVSSSNSTASLSLHGSGSTLFEVIGSEGTIFSLEDDLDGTLFTVNDRSGIPMLEVSASGRIVAEEGESIIRSQRPMVTHTADFSITSSLDFAGKYHIVGGDLTCSINTSSIVPAGAEFEFFQTSSVGNFLFMTGSPHVDLIVKNDNLNLAGRGSGATLKYIGGSTFHLVGDLT